MNPKEQIHDLETAVNGYLSTIEDLPDPLFLTSMNGWSPRDVTAHLIGWCHHTITACDQIIRGELPDYFEDAENDYRNINARSVNTYASENKINLLAELTDSFRDLKEYLETLTYQNWIKDYGVRYHDWVITVHNTVLAIQKDFESHQADIEAWAREENTANAADGSTRAET